MVPRSKIRLSSICLLLSANVFAEGQAIQFSGLPPSAEPILLKVTQKPLSLALDVIAKQAGIIVHHSGLPKTPVSADCADAALKQIFECLLDKKADLMFRYAQNPSAIGSAPLEEVWILGVEKGHVQTLLGGLNGAKPLKDVSNTDEMTLLLAQAQSKNAQDRANAIAALALKPTENSSVRNTLVAALSDQHPEVRGQAVFALGKYKDAGVESLLELALQDDDASVRLMVVDSAANYPGLWTLALNDPDESIRAAASMKLAGLQN